MDSLRLAVDQALAYPYKLWGYGEGPALLGVLRAVESLQRPDLVDAVADIVTPSLSAAADEEIDHLIPVETLLFLHRLQPAVKVQDAADRFVNAVAGAVRPVIGRPQVHRPHHSVLGRTIWVDCLHTDGPGLAAAGRVDAACAVARDAVLALQDGSGLFSHGYRVDTGLANGVHWARGQGWALYGLVGLLRYEPPHAEVLTDSLARLIGALAEQETDGRWHTIVDDAESPAEASLTAMVAGALGGARTQSAFPAEWQAMADRALSATLAGIRPDGSLPVSAATPVGDAAAYYEPASGVFPWGQGPLIDALLVALGRQS
ncbi:MAG: glycoside hydrolase family 88 protein [Jatrophihabitans sp.]